MYRPTCRPQSRRRPTNLPSLHLTLRQELQNIPGKGKDTNGKLAQEWKLLTSEAKASYEKEATKEDEARYVQVRYIYSSGVRSCTCASEIRCRQVHLHYCVVIFASVYGSQQTCVTHISRLSQRPVASWAGGRFTKPTLQCVSTDTHFSSRCKLWFFSRAPRKLSP